MIMIRDVNAESDGISLSRANHIVGKTTLYDMELDRSAKRPHQHHSDNGHHHHHHLHHHHHHQHHHHHHLCGDGRVQMWKT